MKKAPTIVDAAKGHQTNRKAIVDYLRLQGPLSGAELARRLKVPSGTVSRVAKGLLEAGLLSATTSEKKRGVGKPPTFLDINGHFSTVVGIELAETTTRLVLADFKGKVFARALVPTPEATGGFPGRFRTLIRSFVDDNLEASGNGRLGGIGLAVSGLVVRRSGKVVSGFLPRGLELNALIEDEFDVPVFSGNDANLAVLAEHTFGGAYSFAHILCLLDRGWVGAGILLNGNVYTGYNNAAGELEAGILNSAEPTKKGAVSPVPFLESFGLERKMKEMKYGELSPDKFLSRAEMVGALADRAATGDEKARELIRHEAKRFSVALRRLSYLLDPEALIVSGDMAMAGELGARMIIDGFAEMCRRNGWEEFKPPAVMFSRLGQDCVTLGAAGMMIETITQESIQNSNNKNG